MPVFLSPGVFVRETDLSQIIPTVASSSAAIVGASNRGPVNKRVLVTDVKQFIERFGEPDTSVGFMHYASLGYLSDGNQLHVTRVSNGALHSGIVINSNTSTTTSRELAAGEDDIDTFSFTTYTDGLIAIFSENPGSWGNDIRVNITNTNTVENTFDIEVRVNEAGNYVLRERWTVSRQIKTDGFGNQLYLENRINGNSQFIRVKDNVSESNSVLPKHTVSSNYSVGTGNGTITSFSGTVSDVKPLQPLSIKVTVGSDTNILQDDGNGNLVGSVGSGTINYSTGVFSINYNTAPASNATIVLERFIVIQADLDDGANGSAVTDGQINTGWDLYTDPDAVDVRILINGGYATLAVQNKMKDLAERRMDCIAIFDTPANTQKASDAINWRRNTQNINSSYCALYSPQLNVFDQFNDMDVDIPSSGHVAGIYARNDFMREPWTAPAGLQRGLLTLNSLKENYTQGERDAMYVQQINVARTFPGRGTAVWGQKTLQSAESALSRVNVRRLLIILEKSISAALLNSVFELNTEFTRLRIKQQIDSFLNIVLQRNGLTDFRTVVDETNNTPAIVDRNELHVDIYLKPTRAAEFIQLQSVITSSDANFNELIGTGGNF